MKRYFQLLAMGLLGGLLVMLLLSRISFKGPREHLARMANVPTQLTGESTPHEVLPLGNPDAKTLARVKELEKMALEKHARDEAAKKTHQARVDIQLYRHKAWTAVIQARWSEFQDLKEQAARSPDRRVPCAICGGKGVLDLCVVCDHTGKCPTCGGTGKVIDGICPTCMGSGKCFLCFGSGKMPCPFCLSLAKEEAAITPDTPAPPADLPID